MTTIIGVDIGTTSTKSVAYRLDPQAGPQPGAVHSVGYPLDEPHPGFAEQDPEAILAAVIETVRSVAARADEVVALSFSTAMHSLIGLDPDGEPLTPSITWADSRASAQAERIRASSIGLALHRRTGTPIHPMSPLTKLVWFREQEPRLFGRVAHWVGIKDYVIRKLCDALVTDHSVASGSGLMNIHTVQWDPEALQVAGVDALQLPELAPTTTRLPPLVDPAALGVPADTAVILGAGDGPLANLGLGAVRPRRGGVLDRHQRRDAGDGAAARRGPARRGVLLRAHRGPLDDRRRDQQRRRGAAVGRRLAGARPRPRRARGTAGAGRIGARRAAAG